MSVPFFLSRLYARRAEPAVLSPTDELLTRVARADNIAFLDAHPHGETALASDRARAVFEVALLAHAEQSRVRGAAGVWRGRRLAAVGMAAAVLGGATLVSVMRLNNARDAMISAPQTADGGKRENHVTPPFNEKNKTVLARFIAPPLPLTKGNMIAAEQMQAQSSAFHRTAHGRFIGPPVPIPGWAATTLSAPLHSKRGAPDRASRFDVATPTAGAAANYEGAPLRDRVKNASNVTYCGVELPATFSTMDDDIQTVENEAAGTNDDAADVTAAAENPDTPLTTPLAGGDEPRFTLSVSPSSKATAIANPTESVSPNDSASPEWGFVVTARRPSPGSAETLAAGYAEASQVCEEPNAGGGGDAADTAPPVRAVWRRCVVRGTDAQRVTIARVALSDNDWAAGPNAALNQ